MPYNKSHTIRRCRTDIKLHGNNDKKEMWDRLNTWEFPCIRPDVMREWFRDNPDDDSLAEALAQVCNRVGILCAESSESNDHWLDYIFYDWDELEGELVQECLSRLKTRGILSDVQGYHNQMKPFMEAHGYGIQKNL